MEREEGAGDGSREPDGTRRRVAGGEAFVVVMAGRWEELQVSTRATLKTPWRDVTLASVGRGAAGWPVGLLLRQGAFCGMGWVAGCQAKTGTSTPPRSNSRQGASSKRSTAEMGKDGRTRARDGAEAAGPRILKDENYDENDRILL